MTLPELLTSEELIAPDRIAGKMLDVNEIPFCAAVYEADFPYTPEFVETVRRATPEAMRKDLAVLRQRLPGFPDIHITDEGFGSGLWSISFDGIPHVANPEKRYVTVAYGSTNIAMDTRPEFWSRIDPDTHLYSDPHPMSPERLQQFSLPNPKGRLDIPTWYRHNLLDHGLGLQLYLRNFAMTFNNFGVEQLRKG